jgi:hypothetical protein
MFIAVVTLLHYLAQPTWARAALAGLGLGLAQLAKFSALPLLAIYAAAPLLLIWPFRHGPASARRMVTHSAHLAGMLTIWLAMTAVCYGGHDLLQPLHGYVFHSGAMAGIQAALPNLPVPFPANYLVGIDGVLADAERGEFANYLLGSWYDGADWRYFPVVLALKTPAPTLLMMALMSCALLLPSERAWIRSPQGKTLAGITLFLLPIFTLTTRAQIGARYLLPLLPLIAVLLGQIGHVATGMRWSFRIAILILMGWLGVETIATHPHYLSYTNGLLRSSPPDPPPLLDSNVDWGQDLPALAKWMRMNDVTKVDLAYFGHADPRIYGVAYNLPGQGTPLRYTAISAQFLYGAGRFSYPLLYYPGAPTIPVQALTPYGSRRPVATAGGSILIFDNSEATGSAQPDGDNSRRPAPE